MLPEDSIFRTCTKEEIWQRYCGFLDLSMDEFMNIQKHLLMEQIDIIANSQLGKKVLRNQRPGSVDEFRKTVPFTKYEDYEPYLTEQNEAALAEKPFFWCHTSGRGGFFKWIPYTQRAFDAYLRHTLAILILASAERKGDMRVKPGERVLFNLPPPPYLSGSIFYQVSQVFSLRVIPPFDKAQEMSFQERIEQGFRMALREGVDVIASIASVLAKIGERTAQQSQKMKFTSAMLHPALLITILRALISSKLNRRPMLPRDLWSPKAIIFGGTDTSIYRKDVAYYWGKEPYEMYGCTELLTIAFQAWNKKWMTFVPNVAFWEFIPEKELAKAKEDKDYQPATVLADELEAGKAYEVVFTHFYGMPLVRYRVGDMIQVVALKDEDTGIALPQIVFKTRIGETINLGSLVELDERTVWQAIMGTGVGFMDWAAVKEYAQGKALVRLYLEPNGQVEPEEVEKLMDEKLKEMDVDYRDVGSMLGLQPVRVTLLAKGTFERYYRKKQSEGADLAHLKPPHMNATEQAIQELLELSKQN